MQMSHPFCLCLSRIRSFILSRQQQLLDFTALCFFFFIWIIYCLNLILMSLTNRSIDEVFRKRLSLFLGFRFPEGLDVSSNWVTLCFHSPDQHHKGGRKLRMLNYFWLLPSFPIWLTNSRFVETEQWNVSKMFLSITKLPFAKQSMFGFPPSQTSINETFLPL